MKTVTIEDVQKRIIDALGEDESVVMQVALPALLFVTASVIISCSEDPTTMAQKFGAALGDLASTKGTLQ